MKNKAMPYSLLILLLVLPLVKSCQSGSESASEVSEDADAESALPDMHTSQISVDWEGIYEGVAPCADCEGIRTRLTLAESRHYILELTYLGKPGQVYVFRDQFSWNEEGSAIQLAGILSDQAATQYQVGENRLIQLDLQGQRIEGELAEKYALQKLATPLTGIHWRLTLLDGEPVAWDPDKEIDAHISLIPDVNRILASGGCNLMNGFYELVGPDGLRIEKLASTKRGCEMLDLESALGQALSHTARYQLEGSNLSLMDERGELRAVFKAIFIK
jgi:copper homeostasis protein (lipoprotein)